MDDTEMSHYVTIDFHQSLVLSKRGGVSFGPGSHIKNGIFIAMGSAFREKIRVAWMVIRYIFARDEA